MCKSNILPSKLNELRKSKNITQEELAAAMSVSNKTVSKWENGDSAPDLAMLAELSKYYGVSTDYLLGIKAKEHQTLTEVVDSLFDGKDRKDAALTSFDIARAVIRSSYAAHVAGTDDESPIPENDSHMTRDAVTGSDFHNFTVRSDNVNLAVMLMKNKADFSWMLKNKAQQKICSLLAFLSDPDAIKLCYFIHSKQRVSTFTVDYTAKNIGVSAEKTATLLDTAVDIKLCKKSIAHLGTGEIDIYDTFGNGNILSIICIAYEYMCGTQNYNFYCGGECKMIEGEKK